MLSNLSVCLAIAEEALAELQELDAAGRTPKPDGQPGYVVALDPDRRSFKQSLVALAFAGMYFDALLYLRGATRLGKLESERIDRNTKYEDKLQLLGVSDIEILATCKRFREARNDLTHEKAVATPEVSTAHFRWAQTEAAVALAFARQVRELLQNAS